MYLKSNNNTMEITPHVNVTLIPNLYYNLTNKDKLQIAFGILIISITFCCVWESSIGNIPTFRLKIHFGKVIKSFLKQEI
jgi:hypothetical protein